MNRIDPYANHQPVKVGGPLTPPPINEPTLGGKLEESLMRTHELDSVLCAIAERVFGYRDSNEANDGPEETKGRPYQPHTIEMALTISERLAQSVGFARTILQKIGDGR